MGLAATTMLTFAPALRNDFVNWDDYSITSNPAYQGLGLPELRWMLTAVVAGHWMPVTWLTLAVDYVVWGLNPVGFHLTSLALHTANAVLVYLVARRLVGQATGWPEGRRRLAAAGAALVFGLHPLRAESVAWVSERRDVLSGFFFLLAVLAYLAACAPTPCRRWLLAASLAAHAGALGSKSVVMTLPLVLLLLDVYPLRRLPSAPMGWLGSAARRAWLEKLPYVGLSLAAAAMSYYAHRRVMAPTEYPWTMRLAVAVHSLWFYVVKTVLPVGLSPIYELPDRVDRLAGPLAAATLGVTAVTVVVVALRRRWPAGLAAWTYYGLTLAPVSGLVFNGVLAADRYSYLPGLGWALLAGAGVAAVTDASARRILRPALARAALGVAAATCLALAVLTWHQVQVWRDSGSLWRHAVSATPDCFMCQTNRGVWLLEQGAPGAGVTHLQRARALRPQDSRPRVALVRVYLTLGAAEPARREYEALRRLDPAAARRLATLFGEGGAEAGGGTAPGRDGGS